MALHVVNNVQRELFTAKHLPSLAGFSALFTTTPAASLWDRLNLKPNRVVSGQPLHPSCLSSPNASYACVIPGTLSCLASPLHPSISSCSHRARLEPCLLFFPASVQSPPVERMNESTNEQAHFYRNHVGKLPRPQKKGVALSLKSNNETAGLWVGRARQGIEMLGRHDVRNSGLLGKEES